MRPLFLGVFASSLAVMALALGVVVLQACDDGTPTARDSSDEDASPTATSVAPPRGAATATPGVSGPTGTAPGPAEHQGERALAILKELADAPRVSGTSAEAQAADYIAGLFRSYGYSTEIMEFEFEGDRFRAGEVSIGNGSIEALTLAGSPGGEVEAKGVYVGLADAAGIGNQDLKGRVAVADRGTLNFIDKYENVRTRGAVALVIVNNKPGPFSGNLTTLAEFPVVSLAQEDGEAVLAAAKAGKSIWVKSPAGSGPTTALNVIARASAGTCTIIVGGHFDSVPAAPGANDNASGTSNVIELARASAADGLDKGLCFVTFGAEESGLYGSKALVERLRTEDELPKYMLNLDVTGIGEDVEVIGTSDAVREALAIAKTEGIPAVASQLPPNSGSDHESFSAAGVPVVFLTSGDFATIHSPQDVTGDISEESLDRVGDLAFAVIERLLREVARG